MAIYIEKIEENNRKIEQLSKNIKRDTEKRKKLLEDNRILSYNALCERYNCGTQELLDIIMREHDQAEMLRANLCCPSPERRNFSLTLLLGL